MTSIKKFNTVSRKERIMRLCGSVLMVLCLLTSMFTMPAYAAGGVTFDDVMQLAGWIKTNNATTAFENKYTKNNATSGTSVDDWTETTQKDLKHTDIPTWSVLVSMANEQNNIASDFTLVKRCCATASQIVNTFRDSAAFNDALKDVNSDYWVYDSTTHTLTPNAPGDQHKLDNAVGKFKSAAASAAADNAFGDIYDAQNWDPAAGVAGDFLQGVYGVVNTIFFAVSNIMLWFFLLQTGFDALYIVAEPIRPFIGPSKGSSSGGLGNNGSGGNILSKIRLPICSTAAEQACGGGGGGLGGNSAGGASAGNAFFSYALKRFPVLLCCAVYLILVTLGYWPKLISWVSSFAVEIIDFIMRIGQ